MLERIWILWFFGARFNAKVVGDFLIVFDFFFKAQSIDFILIFTAFTAFLEYDYLFFMRVYAFGICALDAAQRFLIIYSFSRFSHPIF